MTLSLLQKWYPPAETNIPLSLFIASIFSHEDNFKDKLCEYLGVEQCILGSSGRALLSELFCQLKIAAQGKRDEVLIPGYTCYSVAASVARAGLKISVYDIDPETFHPDLTSLRERMSERTLAVVVQHLFGIPSPMDEISHLSRNIGCIVVEDAAQCLGGRSNGSLLGTKGDYGIFSFGRGKPLPLGSGGALISKDDSVLGKVDNHHSARKECVELLRSTAVAALSHPRIYGAMEFLPLGLGETIFDPDFVISPMARSMRELGCHALSFIEVFNSHRQKIAGLYQENLLKGLAVSLQRGEQPVYPRFPILAGEGSIPSPLVLLGARRMYPKAIIDEPSIRPHLAGKSYETPGAREVSRRLVTLPTHTRITESTAHAIASHVNSFYGKA